jgi:hypothetical protein
MIPDQVFNSKRTVIALPFDGAKDGKRAAIWCSFSIEETVFHENCQVCEVYLAVTTDSKVPSGNTALKFHFSMGFRTGLKK